MTDPDSEHDMLKDSSMSCMLVKVPKPSNVSYVVVSSAQEQKVKRVAIGGRGREWSAECLKLLKVMASLDDAEIFKQPMDPIKYSDYYSSVTEPLDLSKILLKLHNGAYPTLVEFTKDVRSMFDNYKNFFRDSTSQYYRPVRRLGVLFEEEVEKIYSRWYRFCLSGSGTTSTSNSSTSRPHTPRSGSLEARIQAIEADNQRIVGNMNGPSSTQPHVATSFPPILPRILPKPICIRLPNPPINVVQSSNATGYLIQSTAKGSLAPTVVPSVSQSNVVLCKSGSQLMQAAVQPSTLTPLLASAKLVLVLDVTNVWFGVTRFKPCQPTIVSEEGIKIVLKQPSSGTTNSSSEFEFMIKAEEIIRCAAYFGNARKHTLFLFTMPNCIRRLPSNLADPQSLSTLIVIFLPALSPRQIADLVFLFWRMGRSSIFGGSGCLLSEVDQKAALSILSNIKPTILSAVVERMKGDASSADLSQSGSTAGDKHASNSKPTSDGSKATQPALDQNLDEEEDSKSGIELNLKTDISQPSSKRKKSVDDDDLSCEDSDPFDDDPSEDYVPNRHSVRVKLTRSRPVSSKRKHRKRCRLQEDESSLVDVVDLPPEMAVLPSGTDLSDFDSIVCKTEVEDGGYEQQQDLLAAVADGNGLQDMREHFTIIQQWEADAAAESDGELGSQDDLDINGDCDNGNLDDNSIDHLEKELEIVLPRSPYENEDVEVDGTSMSNAEFQDEIDDLVMTGEKITLRCPITQQVMQHPMKNRLCGHCYDRHGVENLIKHRSRKARCPVPGCCNEVPLIMSDLDPDDSLLQFIQTRRQSGGRTGSSR